MKHGKKYVDSVKLVDSSKVYESNEALDLVCKTAKAKFDETVELHIRLGVDSRHADQQVRGAVVLPNGTGRTIRTLVFCKPEKANDAKEAGADYIADDETVSKIQGGWMDFDVLIATPNMMGKLGRLGRILGPKGLMPNPKTGTVTMDVANAVNEVKKGKVTYRVDKDGNINVLIGKVSFDDGKLVENFNAIFNTILKARPTKVKGTYMKNLVLSTTMGPGIKVEIVK